MSKSTIYEHFVKLGYINCFDVWVPHDLTEKNLMDRISISIRDSLYKRNEKTPFLKQVVTGDEKWIIYNNVERKRSWGKRHEPPQNLPSKKGHALCLMGLERNPVLLAFTKQRDNKFREVLFPIRELKTAIEQKQK